MIMVVRIAADSTMLRMVNLLIALSLGVHREQLLHRMGFTCPRPCCDTLSVFLSSRVAVALLARPSSRNAAEGVEVSRVFRLDGAYLLVASVVLSLWWGKRISIVIRSQRGEVK